MKGPHSGAGRAARIQVLTGDRLCRPVLGAGRRVAFDYHVLPSGRVSADYRVLPRGRVNAEGRGSLTTRH